VSGKPLEDGSIESFSADMVVVSSNSRIAGSERITSEYTITYKVIDKIIYTRMDYKESSSPSGKPISVLTNGVEIVFLDENNNEIGRQPVEGGRHIYAEDGLFTHSNVENVLGAVQGARGISTDAVSRSVVVEYDVEETGLESQQASYDSQTGLLTSAVAVRVEEDGTKVTSTTRPVYQQIGDRYVPIGELFERSFDFPYTIDVSDREFASLSPGQVVPEVTEAQLEALIEEGALVLTPDPIIGDAGNPDYDTTTVTAATAVTINQTPGKIFQPVTIPTIKYPGELSPRRSQQ